MNNIFIPNHDNPQEEQFDTILKTPNIHIEKITSYAHVSDKWYEQEHDEWVVLLEGEGHLLFKETSASQTASACFEDEQKITLKKGEYIFIPRMKRHKVVYTSSPAIWLAVHFKTEQ